MWTVLYGSYGDIISDHAACDRFLEASNGDIDRAAEMLTEHCQWRESFCVDTITDEDFSDLAATGMNIFTKHTNLLKFSFFRRQPFC